MDSERSIVARAYPWCVAIVLASAATPLNSGLPTAVGTFVGGSLVALGLLTSRRRVAPAAAVSVFAMTAAVVWFAVTSARAISPVTSFIGSPGGHRGTALWALAAVWLVAGILAADGRALRQTLAVVSIAGGAFTSVAVWEALRSGVQRGQGAAAGVFENSSSLGSFLAVSAVAALAWAFLERRSWVRVIAATLSVVSAGGLLLSGSRTGFLGVVFSLMFALLVVYVPASRAKRSALALGPPLLTVALASLLAVASSGSLGSAARALVATAGTQRDVLWRSALAQIAQSPLIGSGLDQFSAALPFRIGAGGSLNVVFANDPHSVPLGVVLGGGALGALLLTAAVAAILWATVSVAEAANRSWGAALVSSAPVVLLGVGLVNWIAPSTMVASFAITGSCLGAYCAKTAPDGLDVTGLQRAAWWVAGGLSAACVALAVAAALSLPGEYTYVSTYGSIFAGPKGDPEAYDTSLRLTAAYRSWPEPGFVRQALRGVTRQIWLGNPEAAVQAEALLLATTRDAEWSGDLALNQLFAAEALDKNSQARFDRYASIAARGAKADPSTGLWWALAANQASRLGLSGRAAGYAKQALGYPLDDPPSRAYLEKIAAE